MSAAWEQLKASLSAAVVATREALEEYRDEVERGAARAIGEARVAAAADDLAVEALRDMRFDMKWAPDEPHARVERRWLPGGIRVTVIVGYEPSRAGGDA